jgi:TM2 domain-containing membrane protein YozV
MIKIFFVILLFSTFNNSQNVDPTLSPLHQKENILKFADHLFCEKDYLRAFNEYMRFDESIRNEEINLKMALSLSAIGDYDKAARLFGKIKENSSYYQSSRLEIMKIHLLHGNYSDLRKQFHSVDNSSVQSEIKHRKLYFLSYLKDEEDMPPFNDFIQPFDASEKEDVSNLYQMKVNPQTKNPAFASILSAIIPGAGKIYTGEISDGIVAFITTSLFAFLAYDNFKADHDFRGWLFGGLAVAFYAGNIYGSFASAQIYNARIKYEFNLELDSFLTVKNFFIPKYDFCK